MKLKKVSAILLVAAMSFSLLAGCGSSKKEEAPARIRPRRAAMRRQPRRKKRVKQIRMQAVKALPAVRRQ